MRKIVLLVLLLFSFCHITNSQELYVFTEPASNMPAKTAGFKLSARYPDIAGFKQRYMPELMVGINKNWMVHVSSTLSNYYSSNVRLESGRIYAKYRFYSNDDVHKHFRMAAFADASTTRSPYIYDEMNLEGDNDGAQAGLIATQLINKLAVSGTLAYTKVFKNKNDHLHNNGNAYNGLNYSLSAGYLVLPKEYTDYKQTNLNLYVEMLGMKSLDNRHYAVDLAPAIQLIFNSNTKINVGYRFQLKGTMDRIAEKSWLIGLEHTLFNVWK